MRPLYFNIEYIYNLTWVRYRNMFYSIFIKLNNLFRANYEYILGKYITSGINNTKYLSKQSRCSNFIKKF